MKHGIRLQAGAGSNKSTSHGERKGDSGEAALDELERLPALELPVDARHGWSNESAGTCCGARRLGGG